MQKSQNVNRKDMLFNYTFSNRSDFSTFGALTLTKSASETPREKDDIKSRDQKRYYIAAQMNKNVI